MNTKLWSNGMDRLLEIREQVRHGMQVSAAIKPILEGGGDVEHYKTYLINVYKYARHSSKIIALAASRCINSYPELGKYLLVHSEEEEGHDHWAMTDLNELGVAQEVVHDTYPVPACSALIGYTHYLAEYGNPVALFGWLYVLESMGDDLGSSLARYLDKNLDLQGKSLRFVAGHGVNDVEHTADINEHLSKFVTEERDRKDIVHAARVVGDLYVRMFNEIAEN
ncbi:MAG: iron-containing redox enzyme family protein [Pseudomonadota bacterium]|nr:iron-containing redox enzyme family protein [Pseudomonadota bacterium]